ncbi:MAG: DUF4386 domain-containing protein [Candidatus Kerfeldbacteria bacterium]
MKEKMTSSRKAALWAGILYLVATVAGVLSAASLGSLFTDGDVLLNVSNNETNVILAAMFALVMAIAVAAIAFMIYPVLKKDSGIKEGLANWYLGSRVMEGGIFLVGILGFLSILALSREFTLAGSVDIAYFETLKNIILSVSDYTWMLGYTVFSVGAIILYCLFYKSKLIPRWLSVWGIIGAPLMLISGLLPLLINEDPNSTLSTMLFAPLAIQELVLAIWLIVKGFKIPEIESGSTMQTNGNNK